MLQRQRNQVGADELRPPAPKRRLRRVNRGDRDRKSFEGREMRKGFRRELRRPHHGTTRQHAAPVARGIRKRDLRSRAAGPAAWHRAALAHDRSHSEREHQRCDDESNQAPRMNHERSRTSGIGREQAAIALIAPWYAHEPPIMPPPPIIPPGQSKSPAPSIMESIISSMLYSIVSSASW